MANGVCYRSSKPINNSDLYIIYGEIIRKMLEIKCSILAHKLYKKNEKRIDFKVIVFGLFLEAVL